MTEKRVSQRLEQFFAGYFHQDWMDDAGRPEEVIDQFLASVAQDVPARLAEDIRTYVADHPDEAELRERLLTDLGCYYDPAVDGLAARDWMLQIASRLSKGY